MNIQLVVRPGLAPGRALLRFGPAAPGAVSLRIGNLPRPGEQALFLNPRFEESEAWLAMPYDIVLPPEWSVNAVDGGIEVEIGPELLWHLRLGRQYEVCASAAGSEPVTGRVTFPKGLMLPGERPTGWRMSAPAEAKPRVLVEEAVEPLATTVALEASLVPAVAPPVVMPPPPSAPSAPTATQPQVAQVAQVDQVDQVAQGGQVDQVAQGGQIAQGGQGGRGKVIAAVAVALLLAGGAAAYLFMGRPASGPSAPTAKASAPAASVADSPSAPTPTTDPAAPERTLDTVRRFLAGNPAAEAARQQAEALEAAGQLLDGQFLLHRYAAEKGDAASARALGRFYDPSTWSADKSPLPAPNPVEAARWYQKAAEAGDAEAQYRYGMLLRSGQTDDADGPERSVLWLNKAASQGHSAAKQVLGQ